MGINLGAIATSQQESNIEKVDRGAGNFSLNLSKGISLDLTKNLPTLKKIKVGLGWDCYPSKSMDLDVFALLLHNNKIQDSSDIVFFNQKDTNKGIVLSGDNRNGEGDGDDETIFVDLDKVPQDISEVLFFANIYEANTRQQNFGMVKNAYIRIINEDTNKEEAIYVLNEEGGLYTAFKFAGLKRNANGWSLETYGEGTHGNVQEIANKYI